MLKFGFKLAYHTRRFTLKWIFVTMKDTILDLLAYSDGQRLTGVSLEHKANKNITQGD
jgi:hypothetical protein